MTYSTLPTDEVPQGKRYGMNCSAPARSPGSLHDAEPHVDRLGSLNHFETFKRNVLAVQALEQARAAAEQHGDEVDKDFVNEFRVGGIALQRLRP